MEFSRQEYWSGLPFSSPGVLPNPGIKPRSPTLRADALPSEPPGNPNSSIAMQQISPYLSILEHQIVTISGSRGWLGSSRWFCYQNKTGTPGLSHSKVSLLTQACGEGDYSVSARPSNKNRQLMLWRLELLDDNRNSWMTTVQFSRSVMSNSLRPHELHHARPPCTSPAPRVHPNLCALSRWCYPAISSSVVPFSSCP